MSENCKTCVFSAKNGKHLMCRRFPPQFYTYSVNCEEIDSTALFPVVGEDDWCGEYQNRQEAKGDE